MGQALASPIEGLAPLVDAPFGFLTLYVAILIAVVIQSSVNALPSMILLSVFLLKKKNFLSHHYLNYQIRSYQC